MKTLSTERRDTPGNFRVLVVEDDAVSQQVALGQLEELGYQADAVADGQEALEALARQRYDLVLMDCQMPRLDGYETTRRLRQRETDGERVPVVAITAHAMDGDREKCLAAGMDDYITKPYREEILSEVLSNWLAVENLEESPAARATGRETSSVLDLSRFNALAQAIGHEKCYQAANLFLSESRAHLETLWRELEAGDPRVLLDAAHTLKGGAANLGAFRLSRMSDELEQLTRNGDRAQATLLLTEIEREHRELADELEAILVEAVEGAPDPKVEPNPGLRAT